MFYFRSLFFFNMVKCATVSLPPNPSLVPPVFECVRKCLRADTGAAHDAGLMWRNCLDGAILLLRVRSEPLTMAVLLLPNVLAGRWTRASRCRVNEGSARTPPRPATPPHRIMSGGTAIGQTARQEVQAWSLQC